jgi:hypothetical protein
MQAEAIENYMGILDEDMIRMKAAMRNLLVMQFSYSFCNMQC